MKQFSLSSMTNINSYMASVSNLIESFIINMRQSNFMYIDFCSNIKWYRAEGVRWRQTFTIIYWPFTWALFSWKFAVSSLKWYCKFVSIAPGMNAFHIAIVRKCTKFGYFSQAIVPGTGQYKLNRFGFHLRTLWCGIKDTSGTDFVWTQPSGAHACQSKYSLLSSREKWKNLFARAKISFHFHTKTGFRCWLHFLFSCIHIFIDVGTHDAADTISYSSRNWHIWQIRKDNVSLCRCVHNAQCNVRIAASHVWLS